MPDATLHEGRFENRGIRPRYFFGVFQYVLYGTSIHFALCVSTNSIPYPENGLAENLKVRTDLYRKLQDTS